MAGPGRPPGQPHTGGRRKGTTNRVVINDAMRKDILLAYKRAGGVKYLVELSKSNPELFVKDVLAKILPAPVREDPVVAVGINVEQVSTTEAAARIAFLLARAEIASRPDEPVSSARVIEPEPAQPDPTPETVTEPVPELPPSTEVNNAPTLPEWRGSRYEQGFESIHPRVKTKRRRDLI